MLRQDVRYALRSFARSPVFALTAALSLAIGIGATSAIFTVANGLLLRAPTGVADPDRLVDLVRTVAGRTGIVASSYPEYLDIRQRATTLDGVYAYHLDLDPVGLGSAGGAERIFANVVSANYFTVLGVRAAAGRLFGIGDGEQPSGTPIAVLSHNVWTRRFNRDPTIVGQTLQLNAHPFTVVGVAHEDFRGTSVVAPDVWVPAAMVAVISPTSGATRLTSRQSTWLMMGARLKPDVTIAQAAAEMDAIVRALDQEYLDVRAGADLRLAATSPIPAPLRLLVGGFFALLMGIVSLVLVIACANVAGVLLARATARRREIAVRLAVGAARGRVVQQLLTESMLLFVAGGVAGLLLARGMLALLVAVLPAFPVPVNLSLPLDSRVVVFTAGLAMIAAMLSGLVPALQASKADVVSTLKDDSQWPSERMRLRNAFVVAQVALSLLLVVVGGLLVRALERVGSIDHGFDPRGVEVASLDLSLAGYTDATGPRFAGELLDRVRALTGVETATLADRPPMRNRSTLGGLTVPGIASPESERFYDTDWHIVDPGYFATLRVPLVAGRDFGDTDRIDTEPVVIVSEATARRLWPGQDAVGRQVLWHFGRAMPRPSGRDMPPRSGGVDRLSPIAPTPLQVIGVVRDLRYSSGETALGVYIPRQQRYTSRLTILARSTHGQRLAHDIRRLVASMEPNLPILEAQTLEEGQTGPVLLQLRLAASVSASVGLIGLLLASIGIYGVTAYIVTRRTREIGVRIALGAVRTDIVRMVLWQGWSLVLIGSTVGLIVAAGTTRLLTLFGVPPLDPVTFGGAAILFAVIGLAACYVPVRRATSVDPVTALRYE